MAATWGVGCNYPSEGAIRVQIPVTASASLGPKAKRKAPKHGFGKGVEE
mgnify:CR=1 FL=1